MHMAGVEAVIIYYNSNRVFMERDKNTEKCIALKKKGRLAEFIESKYAKMKPQ
jgi:hypothetical protein